LEYLKKKLEIKPGEVVFLTAGSLIVRKGMDTVISAFNDLKLDHPRVRLLILGDGRERENLEILATNDSRICFIGFQEKEDVPYYYALADIFVFASRYDGWGLVINEAIAAGLPIISTFQCTAANQMIKDGQNGFLCHAESTNCFLGKMKLLVNNETLRLSMKTYNRAFSKEVNSIAYATKLLRIVSSFE
jgi:glycosyltransferase involved in cell wall biosynthesis